MAQSRNSKNSMHCAKWTQNARVCFSFFNQGEKKYSLQSCERLHYPCRAKGQDVRIALQALTEKSKFEEELSIEVPGNMIPG